MNDTILSLKSQIGLLILVSSIFFFNFLARILPAPLMPTIERHLGLDHTEAGGFFLLISIGYCTSLVGSGFLSRWLTHRNIITLSSLATGAALLLVSVSSTLVVINLGLIFLGLAAGAYLPSGITAITSSIKTAHWGKAIAVHEMAPAIAYIAAPLISELLLTFCSWQGVFASIGAMLILFGLLFLLWGRGGDFKGDTPNIANIGVVTQNRTFWIMTVLFSVGIATSMGVFNMLPLYLVAERGFERTDANTIIGFSRIPSVLMALIAGWISDRLGPRRTMRFVLIFNGIMTIFLGIVPGEWVLVMIFLQPMLSACFFPAGFSFLSRTSSPNIRNLTIAITIFFAYLAGAGLIPAGMGILGDAGQFSLSIVLVGSLILASVVLFRYMEYTENESGS
ncbi:MAG: MFS transporter [Deltaproteobacteria bacterium]|nr:MFS transporter [Deltaproteobacteria bacterium]